MTTADYDVVVEINEKLINTFMEIGFSIGKFPSLSGNYTLPLNDVENLQEFTNIGYEVSLAKAPIIDFTSDNSLMMNVKGQVKLTLLDGIEFELEAEFKVTVSPSFDQTKRLFMIEFFDAIIEDVIIDNTYQLPETILNKFNEIFRTVMKQYLTEDVKSIELSPTLFALELPNMPDGDQNRLRIGLGNVKVLNSSVMAGAVNLLGYDGGNVNAITDFTAGNNLGIGINEEAMHRVYDFWWTNTTLEKLVKVSHEHEFDKPIIMDFWDELVDWIAAIVTLGLVDVDFDIDRVWAEYDVEIEYSKFDFDLKSGGTVQLSGSIKINLELSVKTEYTVTTSTLWGLGDSSKKTKTVKIFSEQVEGISVHIDNAEGIAMLNKDNELVVAITDLDFTIPLSWELPEKILDYVVESLVNFIIDNMSPRVVLFPAIIAKKIPDTSLLLHTTVQTLEINETEALITAGIWLLPDLPIDRPGLPHM